MDFPEPLQPTRLIQRYKRFLADVIHPELGEITVHCPNTGSMKNCWDVGWTAWILDSHNEKRKYRHTWVLSQSSHGEMIGINTHFANEIVYEGILNSKVAELNFESDMKKEVRYGEENSRIDILLTGTEGQKTYVEVKSVTLLEADGVGYFPDAVTTRGQKHLRELIHCVEQGHRAVLFFLVQHSAIKQVSVASHVDPDYADLLNQAANAGVEILAYRCKLSPNSISLDASLPFER